MPLCGRVRAGGRTSNEWMLRVLSVDARVWALVLGASRLPLDPAVVLAGPLLRGRTAGMDGSWKVWGGRSAHEGVLAGHSRYGWQSESVGTGTGQRASEGVRQESDAGVAREVCEECRCVCDCVCRCVCVCV